MSLDMSILTSLPLISALSFSMCSESQSQKDQLYCPPSQFWPVMSLGTVQIWKKCSYLHYNKYSLNIHLLTRKQLRLLLLAVQVKVTVVYGNPVWIFYVEILSMSYTRNWNVLTIMGLHDLLRNPENKGHRRGLTYLFPAHLKQVESARMKNRPSLLRPRMHC